MPAARKGADLLRDPRFALHGPTFHPEEGKESEWPGEAKIAGRAHAVGPVTAEGEEGPEGEMFVADITEVVITHLDPAATKLVIESWTPERGLRVVERDAVDPVEDLPAVPAARAVGERACLEQHDAAIREAPAQVPGDRHARQSPADHRDVGIDGTTERRPCHMVRQNAQPDRAVLVEARAADHRHGEPERFCVPGMVTLYFPLAALASFISTELV